MKNIITFLSSPGLEKNCEINAVLVSQKKNWSRRMGTNEDLIDFAKDSHLNYLAKKAFGSMGCEGESFDKMMVNKWTWM